ncbi:protein HAIKU1 [Abeliophyllum distichum]|uniref:Protein HAIKU1 n=1 Tax=Abeliophyllum distichum TaxID=126358 RepID=A0ABD1R9Z3_9LAMI
MDFLERFLGVAADGKLPASNRLHRIGPPPMASMNRPRLPIHPPMPMPAPAHPPTDVWANTAKSPISAYMRYLQNSIVDPGFRQPQPQYQPHLQPHVLGQNLAQPPSSGLLPNPTMQQFQSHFLEK